MALRIFSTLTSRMEEFRVERFPKTSLFLTGPAVFNDCHIGHGRTFTVFDFLVRYLEWHGYRVSHAQGINDVDDRVVARAAREELSAEAVGRRFLARFQEDMAVLGNRRADRCLRWSQLTVRVPGRGGRVPEVGGGAGLRVFEGAVAAVCFPDGCDLHGRAAHPDVPDGPEVSAALRMETSLLDVGASVKSAVSGAPLSLREAFARWDPATLRYLFLSCHYRAPLAVTEAAVSRAGQQRRAIAEFASSVDPVGDDSVANEERAAAATRRVMGCLDEDLDTPGALAAFRGFAAAQRASGERAGPAAGRVVRLMDALFGTAGLSGGGAASPDVVEHG